MDGRYIEGYALEVSYKPAIPIPRPGVNIPVAQIDYSQATISPPQPLWTAAPRPSPYQPPPFTPVPGPEPPFPPWPYPSIVREVVPQMQPIAQVMAPPVPTVAPEPSPPPPYSALPPIPEASPESSSATAVPLKDPGVDTIPPKTPYDPCNLFIKNLDDEVIATQRDLENYFAPFGIITSAFLATYTAKDDATPPVSKGFGFVAFSRPQEAEIAKDKVHGTIIGRKKVFVSYAEKKEDRQMRLKVLFANMEKLANDSEQKVTSAVVQTEEVARDEGISRRGIIRSRFDDGSGSVQPVPGSSPISPRSSKIENADGQRI